MNIMKCMTRVACAELQEDPHEGRYDVDNKNAKKHGGQVEGRRTPLFVRHFGLLARAVLRSNCFCANKNERLLISEF